MSKRMLVIDSTGHIGDVRNLLASVEGHRCKFSDCGLAWVANPEQVPLLKETDLIRIADDQSTPESIVCDWVTEMSQNGHAGSVFHVLTYRTSVLKAAAALNSDDRLVIPEHLGGLKDARRGLPTPLAPHPSVMMGPVPMTVDEAVDLAKKVLATGGHLTPETAMHQPRLRLKMAEIEPRARRLVEDRRTWNLIRDVVDRGRQEGWLQQERRGGNGFEYVWLTPASVVIGPPNSPPKADDAKDSAKPAGPIAPVAGSDKPVSAMEAVLRAERIGSPPVPRKFIFDAVEEVLSTVNGTPQTLAALMREVCARAQKLASEVGYDREQKWSAICECVFRAMLQAQVLRTDAGPIPAGIGSHSARPTGLAADFRDRTLALMAERVIQKIGGLKLTDAFLLGLMLFQQGKGNAVPREELLARIDQVLKLLLEENRIQVTEAGLIVVLVKLG